MLKFKTSCAVLANLSSNLLNEVGLSLFRYFEVGLRVCDIVVNKYVRYLISWWVLVSSTGRQRIATIYGCYKKTKKVNQQSILQYIHTTFNFELQYAASQLVLNWWNKWHSTVMIIKWDHTMPQCVLACSTITSLMLRRVYIDRT